MAKHLNLFLSHHYDAHLSELEINLFSKSSDPIKKRYVIIPCKATKQHLIHSLSRFGKRGYCLGIQFFTLQEFTEFLFSLIARERLVFPRDEILALHIQDILNQELGIEQPIFSPIKDYLAEDPSRISDLARCLAKAFKSYDRFGNCNLDTWREKPSWQQAIWKEVTKYWPFFHELSQNDQIWDALPFSAEVHFFLITHLSEVEKRTLSKLARTWDTFFYFYSPSAFYWGDLSSDHHRLSLQKYFTKQGVNQEMRDEIDQYARNTNRLLANLSKLGIDLLRFFTDQSCVMRERYEEIKETCLLDAIKNDILHLQNPDELDEKRPFSHSGVQIHVAATRLREIEILYNNILYKFAKDPSLKKEDIGIFAPRIAPYYPYIQMIFAREQSALKNFAVSDLPLHLGSKYLQMLKKLFSFVHHRMEAYVLFDLFYSPLFMEKFHLTEKEIDTWKLWAEELHVHWGYDEKERKEALGYPSYQGTWSEMFERLITSLISLDGEAVRVELSQTDLLNTFIQVLERLHMHLTSLQKEQKSLSSWVNEIIAFASAFLFVNESEQTYYSTFVEHVRHLLSLHSIYGESTLSFAEIEPYILGVFDQSSYTYHNESHTPLVFSNLIEGAVVSKKHIFLLGMDEDQFPHIQDDNPLNELKHLKGYGFEPTSSDQDRYAFLKALLHANQSLTVSYQNTHPEDGKEQNPSLVIQELTNYIDEYFTLNGASPLDQIYIYHPVIPFHHSYFSKKQDLVSLSSRDYSFAQYFYQAATSSPKKTEKNDKELPKEWDLNHLLRIASHPLRFYAQQNLGIYLEEMKPEDDANEEFVLNALEKYSFKNALSHQEKGVLLDSYRKHSSIISPIFQEIASQELETFAETIGNTLDRHGWKEASSYTITLHPECKSPFKKSEHHWVLPTLLLEDLEGNSYRLVGTLTDYSPKGILSLGKDNTKNHAKLWPKILLYQLLSAYVPTKTAIYFAEEDKEKTFHINDPKEQFAGFLSLARKAYRHPSPILPDWISLIGDREKLFKEIEKYVCQQDLISKDPYTHFFHESFNYLADKKRIEEWIPSVEKAYQTVIT